MMSRNLFFTLVIIGLLLSNVFLAFLLLGKKPGRRGPDGPRKAIIEKLKLDDKQISVYDSLISIHKNEIRANQDQLHKAKHDLYSKLKTDDAATDSLFQEIATLQAKIENTHYQHFRDIRKICRPEQMKAYETVTDELGDLFGPHPRRE